MIESIRIRNFKSLKDTGKLSIKPITVLVGPNSSGKSSVLQTLLMLRQTVESADFDTVLTTNSTLVRLGNYPDFIHRHSVRRSLQIDLVMKDVFQFYRRKRKQKAKTERMELSCAFAYSKMEDRILLKRSEIVVPDEFTATIAAVKGYKDYTLGVTLAGSKSRKVTMPVRPINFHRFAVKNYKGSRNMLKLSPNIWNTAFNIDHDLNQIHYIGPLRESPKRIYLSSGITPSDVGARGEKTVDTLWVAEHEKSKRIGQRRQEINVWLQRLGLAKGLCIERIGTEGVFRAMITDPTTTLKINLLDVGFGVSQVLPVVTESFLSSPSSLIMLEQPEIHLHPGAQATLADMFIEASREGQKSFLIETHSEHLLARLCRRIADPDCYLTPEHVAIYYFDSTKSGTTVRPVTLNDNGQFVDFPDGFFEEDVEEALEHLAAIGRRD